MRSVEPPLTSTTGGPSPSRSKAMAVPSRDVTVSMRCLLEQLPGPVSAPSTKWSEPAAGSRHPMEDCPASGPETGRPALQVALLGEAGGGARGRAVVLAGGLAVAGQLQQVG